MSEILRETTTWSTDYSVCNHTYLLGSGNRVIAYINANNGLLIQPKTQLKIDKRYRTFVRDNHPELIKLQKSLIKNSDIRIFKVKSKEKEYTVTKSVTSFTCSCTGFNFRGKCKHVDAVAKKLQSPKSS